MPAPTQFLLFETQTKLRERDPGSGGLIHLVRTPFALMRRHLMDAAIGSTAQYRRWCISAGEVRNWSSPDSMIFRVALNRERYLEKPRSRLPEMPFAWQPASRTRCASSR